MKKSKSEQIFIKILEKNKQKFLKKLASYQNMTLHKIWLKNDYRGWNADFTEMIPAKIYGALLSYTT